jgi:hypothetical protein
MNLKGPFGSQLHNKHNIKRKQPFGVMVGSVLHSHICGLSKHISLHQSLSFWKIKIAASTTPESIHIPLLSANVFGYIMFFDATFASAYQERRRDWTLRCLGNRM